MTSYRDKTFCTATECRKFVTCADALTEFVKYSAEQAGLPVATFGNPGKLTCYRPHVQDSNPVARSPKTKVAAKKLYGTGFVPENCIHIVVENSNYWQCGHRNGKGNRGLYCGKHATLT